MTSDGTNALEKRLLDQYGPLMGGRDLVMALGYRTLPAFRKACRENLLGITVFTLPNRKGRYAFTRDVADWLVRVSGTATGTGRVE